MKGLLNLVTDCLEVGGQLLSHVDNLLLSPANPSRLQSLRQSFRIKFQRPKLDLYVQRLETLHSALSFDVVLSLIRTLGRHHAITDPKIDLIQEDVRTIVGKIEGSDTLGQGAPALANGTDNLDHQNISETIQRCMERLWKENTLRYQNGGIIYTNAQWDNAVNPSAPNTELNNSGSWQRQRFPLSAKEQGMLKMLKFRQMTDRFEEISPACRKTFELIFQPRSNVTVWDSFTDFLNSDVQTGPYWINGKAASGKSTLMRFILEHERFQSELRKWSASDELIVVSFFFWELGTLYQKSRIGLFRALFFTIFEKHPELIRAAFPSLWEDWKASDENYVPSYNELKTGFLKLIKDSISGFRICIMVDGIDEFDGDHEQLSMFLNSIVSHRVKVVISSRPISNCVTIFQGCPSLRLQDLTLGDIKIFIEEYLYKHPEMKALERQHPDGARKLVHEIREKANGVFLWVKLVVKLLIQGMQNGDQLSDLQRRLQSLPPDLKDLYERMFRKMDTLYQIQAAETFQIIRRWDSVRPTHKLTTLMLSYATRRPENWTTLQPKPLDPIEALSVCKRTEAWVRSRCCGLVEVHEDDSRKKQSHFQN